MKAKQVSDGEHRGESFMKEYESPRAEYLQLDDVITASGATEPCKCWKSFSLPGEVGEVCKAMDMFGGFENKPGI